MPTVRQALRRSPYSIAVHESGATLRPTSSHYWTPDEGVVALRWELWLPDTLTPDGEQWMQGSRTFKEALAFLARFVALDSGWMPEIRTPEVRLLNAILGNER